MSRFKLVVISVFNRPFEFFSKLFFLIEIIWLVLADGDNESFDNIPSSELSKDVYIILSVKGKPRGELM